MVEKIAGAIRRGLAKVEVALDPATWPVGKSGAIVSGNGSIEAGLWGEGLTVQLVTTFEEARDVLALERTRVLKCLLRESHKIFRGIEAGHLERGDFEIAFAQLVMPGRRGSPVKSLAGFSIYCDPADGSSMRLRRSALEESWKDLFEVPDDEPRSLVSNEQIEAYRQTKYVVFADPPFTLRVGKASRELGFVYASERTNCAALITAWNWGGKRIGRRMNDLRQRQLASDVRERGFWSLLGEGLSTSDHWENEQSLLILGVSETEARALGTKYGQNAIVWAGPDTIPNLIILR